MKKEDTIYLRHRMRDKLIHNYLGVDLDAVWDTVEKDLPVLKNKIERIIEK